jgi:uncharacterized protein YegL
MLEQWELEQLKLAYPETCARYDAWQKKAGRKESILGGKRFSILPENEKYEILALIHEVQDSLSFVEGKFIANGKAGGKTKAAKEYNKLKAEGEQLLKDLWHLRVRSELVLHEEYKPIENEGPDAFLKVLAEKGHAGQFRKDGKTPYIEHPRAVVALLCKWGVYDKGVLATAWGHDLLEDTNVTEGDILQYSGLYYGKKILADIDILTRDEKRFHDKGDWLDYLAKNASPEAILVKAADRLCNTRDFIALGDPNKAEEYLSVSAKILTALPVKQNEVFGEYIKVQEEVKAALQAGQHKTAKKHKKTSDKKGEIATGITELYFVLDRSGSMSNLVRSTIDGFNSMIEKQKRETGGELFVSTVLFDDQSVVLHDHAPVADIQPLTERESVPRGCTALNDAFGAAIRHAVGHQRHAAENRRAEHVIFVIITDGYENASQKYSTRKIAQMVSKEQNDYGWEFIYLGANIDSFASAGALGIASSRTANFVADGAGLDTVYTGAANVVTAARNMSQEKLSDMLSGSGWKADIDRDYAKRGGKRS